MVPRFLMLGFITAVLLQLSHCQSESNDTDTDELSVNQERHDRYDDIILTPDQQIEFEIASDIYSPQNAVIKIDRGRDRRWQNGIVPYSVSSTLSNRAKNAINDAIADYHSLTCLRFVQRTTEEDYILFFRGRGCYSNVGRVGGGQVVSIGSGCETKGIVLHEIFHALGRWHEQSRPDRDLFVRVIEENIISQYRSNFLKIPSSFVSTQGVSYDYGSIMHYRANAFAFSGTDSIVPLQSGATIGQRVRLSTRDIQHVKALYCSPSSFVQWSSWSSWSSCSLSCNRGIRTRTRTCRGGTSCQGTNIESEYCNTQRCPTPAQWSSWSAWGRCSVTCGTGRRVRTRTCRNGNNCIGESAQYENCNTQSCPLPASWGQWGGWSQCSKTCHVGRQVRRRQCQNGNTCPGQEREERECNRNVNCQPDPENGEWSQWSSCSRTCGGGTRVRSKGCTGSNTLINCEHEEQPCNRDRCPDPTSGLGGLDSKGCYRLPSSFTSGIRSIERRTSELFDYPPRRQDAVKKCGIAAQKLGFTVFGVAFGYCISGSNDLSNYVSLPAEDDAYCNHKDGEGGYVRGFFINVYEIENQQSFVNSATESIDEGATEETEDENESSSSASLLSSTLLLVFLGSIIILPLLL